MMKAYVKQNNGLFLLVLATALVSACAVSDGERALVIIPNPVTMAAHEISKFHVNGKDDRGFRLFTDDQIRYMSETGNAWSYSCRDLSYNKSKIIPMTGLRLEGANFVHSLSARGYDSVFDFYAAFDSRRYHSTSVVESTQIEILTQKLPIFFEFKSQEGKWKRSSYDAGTDKVITQDVDQSIASHSISFEQAPTGYEHSYKIYGVTMTVRDVATNTIVAQNTGIAKDLYNGFHSRYSLIPDSRRCTYPEENNYVGAWLTSLIKERDPLRNVPYDGFDDGKRPRPEQIRWAHTCTLPQKKPDTTFYGVDENASGRIVSINSIDRLIKVKPYDGPSRPKTGNVTIHVPSGIAYTLQGGELSLDEIPTGEETSVWYEDCRRVSGRLPEAAFVLIHNTATESKIPWEKWKQKKAPKMHHIEANVE